MSRAAPDKCKWLRPSLVQMPFSMCICVSEKAFEKKLDSLNIPKMMRPPFERQDADAVTHFFADGDGDTCCVITITRREGYDDSAIAGLIAHEAVHVWQEVREKLGEDKPSSEFEAYGIQAITHSLLDSYKLQKAAECQVTS